MIFVISPSIAAKANAIGLTELYDVNNDGHINSEDVNLLATKQGIIQAATVNPDAVTDNPVVAKELVQSAQ